MTLTLAGVLGVAVLLAVAAGARVSRVAGAATVAFGVLLALIDTIGWTALADAATYLGEIRALDVFGEEPLTRLVGVLALLWCGPPADMVVRAVLRLTGIDMNSAVDAEEVRTGRWLGRLERWFMLIVIASGQPGLAAIPVGGKALFRYAETVADTHRAASTPNARRDLMIEYIIIGSFASWGQATFLALTILGGRA